MRTIYSEVEIRQTSSRHNNSDHEQQVAYSHIAQIDFVTFSIPEPGGISRKTSFADWTIPRPSQSG